MAKLVIKNFDAETLEITLIDHEKQRIICGKIELSAEIPWATAKRSARTPKKAKA